MDNTIHCQCHKSLETRLHQHSGGTGSAPASYLPQLAGGCVALGTSTSSGAGGGGGITGTASAGGPFSLAGHMKSKYGDFRQVFMSSSGTTNSSSHMTTHKYLI